MRAHPPKSHALIVAGLLSTASAFAADSPATTPAQGVAPVRKAAGAAKLPPLPKSEPSTAQVQVQVQPPAPTTSPIPPGSAAEANRERLSAQARLDDKEKPPSKPVAELLTARLALLEGWKKAAAAREAAEKPRRTPEAEAAEIRVELEKTRALLDQAGKAPDALLPEVFRIVDNEKVKAGDPKRPEGRLAEMKEAIDSARNDLKDQSAQLETLRAEGSRTLAAQITAMRAERDKVFQGLAGLTAQRGEGLAGAGTSASGEAREVARERLANLEWQARAEAERLAAFEAGIALDTRRIDLGTLQIQARVARVQLARKLADRMDARYEALAERRRNDLKQAVAKEETRAAASNDPLERRRAQRTAQLLELESQVVAYEKTYATAGGASIQRQSELKDRAVTEFAELKKLLDDGSVSPLDALRLKNDFRRIAPERAQVVRTDLAATEAELTHFENALTDAEIDLVNDDRDDRFDRESLLEQLPAARRGEAEAMLDELEARHKALLNRRRNVLRNLARQAEEAHTCVVERVKTLDLQYAFIRTHIFWIRDAEPIGATTLAHARDDSLRTAKALGLLALESGDRNLWGRTSPAWLASLVALMVVPLPLLLGRRALDRMRLADASE